MYCQLAITSCPLTVLRMCDRTSHQAKLIANRFKKVIADRRSTKLASSVNAITRSH